MSFFKIDSEIGKVKVIRGVFRYYLKEHYKNDFQARELTKMINEYAPEVKGKQFIPKPALQKVVDGIGYVCED